jgi:MYXO-CTERM domain-containing protein
MTEFRRQPRITASSSSNTWRSVALLVRLASLGALALGCNAGRAEPPAAAKSAGENVGKTTQALAAVDGDVTIDSANSVVNQYTTLAADATAGQSSITVSSVAALKSTRDLAPGDLLLVIQMQGATLDTTSPNTNSGWGSVTLLNGAGLYEFAEVKSVDAATGAIGLSCALSHSYAQAGAVEVVRVPQYDTLTVSSGASIVAPVWDGTTGGVVAVHAKTTLNLAGAIDVSAKGFRGGITDDNTNAATTNTTLYASTSDSDGARKGEGIGGFAVEYGRAPSANGGGGGNSHNGGGGGGANARSGAAWTGQGVFDLTVTGGATAWLLDPNYSATGSEGGGRGGYSYSNSNQDATTLAPGNANWMGNQRRQRGGLGGHPLDSDPANRIFFGGGGGAGDGNNGHAGAGGVGGGIAFVIAGSVTGTGSILANGGAGVDADSTSGGSASGDAPGGGGGGGTVIVSSSSVSAITISANGGAGGTQLLNSATEAEGPGGGGGGGYVAVKAGVNASVLGGVAGTTSAPSLNEFPVNGATNGNAGSVSNAAFTPAYCVDASVPDTTIATHPNDPTNDATGDFTFTSDDPAATFECQLDGGAYAACSATYATGTLAEGSHTLNVRAKDTVGNVDATPATFTWKVDLTAPETTIATKPSDPTTDTTGDFTFTANEPNVTFACNLDGAGFTSCTAAFTTAALAPGQHDIAVRATDAAGNTDATPATFTWNVTTATDTDADGIPDATETQFGTDPNDADSDDDGVPDGQESSWNTDSDGDGLINALDPDSDNDGILDGTELGKNCSGTGTNAAAGHCVADADPATQTDPLNPDTDGGGIHDGVEDANHNGKIDGGEGDPNDPADDVTAIVDSDGDGLSDAEEAVLHTDPHDADSDDDGVPDGAEPNPGDDTDGDGLINALDPDSDDDGLFDGTELGLGCGGPGTDASRHVCVADGDSGATKTSPLLADTDGGGARDGSEDANLNGVLDAGETDPTSGKGADDAGVVDTDHDGLSDGLEHTLRSDPNDADSDDDGVPDGAEPNPSADYDRDGLPDVLDVDSDNDGLFDGTELGRDCSGSGTDAAAGHCRADADPATVTSPVNRDTDFGGASDGSEDTNLDGNHDGGELEPTVGNGADDTNMLDSDGDGLSDGTEQTLGSDPNDADSDDDGLLDGAEPNPGDDRDGDTSIDVLDPDSDGDGLFDGTEAGLDCANAATDASKNVCIADADPSTSTWVLVSDTDHGGVTDGMEDTNHDGHVETGEGDPLDPTDDTVTNGEGGAGGEAGEAGNAGEGGAEVGAGGTAGSSGTAGSATAEGGSAGSTGGTATAGTAGTAGSPAAGSGGSSGSGGAPNPGGSDNTAGTTTSGTGGSLETLPDNHAVVLGGGFCSTSPRGGSSSGAVVLVGLGLAGALRSRRRRSR